MPRPTRSLTAVLALWCTLTTGIGLTSCTAQDPAARAGSGDQKPSPTTSSAEQPPTPMRYVALGDSLPAGYLAATAQRKTDTGYPTAVRAGVEAHRRGVTVELVNLACSGETTQTFLRGKGFCEYGKGSQLNQALAEIARPGHPVSLITVQIGANDVWPCGRTFTVDRDCVRAARQAIFTDIPQALTALRAAAPQARILLLDYYNPLLLRAREGGAGLVEARSSTNVVADLNQQLADLAGQQGAEYVSVSKAYVLNDWERDQTTGQYRNVDALCSMTFMCDRLDIHPNAAGHAAIAAAVLDVVRTRP